MNRELNVDISLPLIVDLDGTLLLTDTFVENFNSLLFSDPLAACTSLLAIHSRAKFKHRVAHHTVPDIYYLPQRAELISLIRTERAKGREVHLITAADQKIADSVAAVFGLFETATGSDGTENLKGQIKLAHVQRRFTQGFIYAGDSASDLLLFVASRGAILCDVTREVASAVAESGTPVLAQFSRPAPSLFSWLHAIRLHQWSKNALLFVPLFVGHAFQDPSKIMASLFGFLLLSVLVSGTYLLNDFSDLSADRRHPTKRTRYFASGNLPLALGLVVAPIMILGALAGAVILSPPFAILLLGYLALTSAYSFGLKRIALTDSFVIGELFALRIAMGTAVLDMRQSPWLLSFSLAFFVSLAFAKRHAEVMSARQNKSPDIAGRGYRPDDWPLTLAFGIGAGLISLAVMLIYLANDAAPSGFYHQPEWLYAVPTLMAVWLMRTWLLSHRMELHDDPVVFALKDPMSLIYGLGVVCAFFLAI